MSQSDPTWQLRQGVLSTASVGIIPKMDELQLPLMTKIRT